MSQNNNSEEYTVKSQLYELGTYELCIGHAHLYDIEFWDKCPHTVFCMDIWTLYGSGQLYELWTQFFEQGRCLT